MTTEMDMGVPAIVRDAEKHVGPLPSGTALGNAASAGTGVILQHVGAAVVVGRILRVEEGKTKNT